MNLKADDFVVGLKIICTSAGTEQVQSLVGGVAVIQKSPGFFAEAIWQIKSICLPFICITIYNPPVRFFDLAGKPYVVDTREYKWMKVSEEFAAAMTTEKKT